MTTTVGTGIRTFGPFGTIGITSLREWECRFPGSVGSVDEEGWRIAEDGWGELLRIAAAFLGRRMGRGSMWRRLSYRPMGLDRA